jgi:hypothetical protein
MLKKYHQLTSPIANLQIVKQREGIREEIKNNVSMKIDYLKNRGGKVYTLNNT